MNTLMSSYLCPCYSSILGPCKYTSFETFQKKKKVLLGKRGLSDFILASKNIETMTMMGTHIWGFCFQRLIMEQVPSAWGLYWGRPPRDSLPRRCQISQEESQCSTETTLLVRSEGTVSPSHQGMVGTPSETHLLRCSPLKALLSLSKESSQASFGNHPCTIIKNPPPKPYEAVRSFSPFGGEETEAQRGGELFY